MNASSTNAPKLSPDVEVLKKLSIEELLSFSHVMNLMGHVATAMGNAPRFLTETQPHRNPAGMIIEDIADFLGRYEQAAVELARSKQPQTCKEARDKALSLLRFEALNSDDIGEVSLIAVSSLSEISKLERRIKRGSNV
jgi:hypothetical protein